MLNKALFLDRDGIFNHVIVRNKILSSPRNWNEVVQYDGLDALPHLKTLGWRLVLVTNQPCLERQEVGWGFIHSYHSYLQQRYQLDLIQCSPYSDANHPYKKPNPGMLLEAKEKLGLDLNLCYHLGDTIKDVGVAYAAGSTPILWNRSYNRKLEAPYRVDTLQQVFDIIN